MELQQALEARRSVRAFTDRALSRSEIDELLRAATLAPSACNMQSWHFYVLTDPAERAKLKGVCADWVAKAPVVFVVCTDGQEIVEKFGSRAAKFPMQDTALAMENLLLKATDMGLGGCIIGAYRQEAVTDALNIPEKYTVVALLPVGEPAHDHPARERKPVSEVSEYIGAKPDDVPLPCNEASAGSYELKHKYLKNALFEDAAMPGARFEDVSLENARFNNINLKGAAFSDANLSGASYAGLNMTGARFECVELNDARFGCCETCAKDSKPCVEMRNARFDHVDLSGAVMMDCQIDGLTIDGVNVAEAIRAYKNAKEQG